jgi:hypothetical protein
MSIPNNIVIAWSGSIASIPTSWFLCDGTNGTPDLRNRFIAAAGSKYSLSSVGGNKDAVNIAHTHTGSTSSSSASHTHTFTFMNSGSSTTNTDIIRNLSEGVGETTSTSGSHSHGLTTNTVGESGVDKNIPPYMALAFIMYGGA